jgi:hypothetical protein
MARACSNVEQRRLVPPARLCSAATHLWEMPVCAATLCSMLGVGSSASRAAFPLLLNHA